MVNLTRQQQVLVGVLGLGLVTLGVDSLFLRPGAGEPAQAAAAAAGEPVAASTPAIASAAPAGVPPVVPGEVAAALVRAAERAGLPAGEPRDAFVPSESWVPRAETVVTVAEGEAVRSPKEFAATHRLGGVMGAGETAVAIVDGRPLRVGQAVEGYVLVEVRARSAVLLGPHGRIELRLVDRP